MDQESWWGSEQFCPADLHATPRNEKILKNWEVRMIDVQVFYGADPLFVTERQADEEDEACWEMGKERETTNTATA
jgi:hypothetical protein